MLLKWIISIDLVIVIFQNEFSFLFQGELSLTCEFFSFEKRYDNAKQIRYLKVVTFVKNKNFWHRTVPQARISLNLFKETSSSKFNLYVTLLTVFLTPFL